VDFYQNHLAKFVYGGGVITVDELCTSMLALALSNLCGRQKVLGRAQKQLGLILCKNQPEALAAYITALQLGQAVMLLEATLSDLLLERIVHSYSPSWIVSPSSVKTFEGYEPVYNNNNWILQHCCNHFSLDIHADLAVLLFTSGSTGSPKTVRLSFSNLQANAIAISSYLNLTSSDKPITTLPISYSYGLSIVNSHLLVGASLVLTDASLASREFWQLFKDERVTSLAGVPFTYQVFARLHPEQLPLDSLDTLTQAGGRLSKDLTQYFSNFAQQRGLRFFVMYGQTEATARISYVPPNLLANKVGSIGIAIPGGQLRLDGSGELLYEGPNVMMGYAESKEDLAKGDELHGLLRTGDLAYRDDDGFYFLQGRIKRFVKLNGKRVSLDSVECSLEESLNCPVAVTGVDDKISIYVADSVTEDLVRMTIRNIFNFHRSTYSIRFIQDLPLTSSGKKDYSSL